MPPFVEDAVAVPLVIVRVHPPQREQHRGHRDDDQVEEVCEECPRDLRVEPNEQDQEKNRKGGAGRECQDVEAHHRVGETVHPGAPGARPPGLQDRRGYGEPHKQLREEHVDKHREAREAPGTPGKPESREVYLGQ